MSAYRESLKRTHGGVTTFLPTEAQAGLLRVSLLRNFDDMEERGDAIWYEAGEKVWGLHNPKETCAPVLIKNKKNNWLFLTHHFLDNSRRDLRRGESDVLLQYGGGFREFVDEFGFLIEEGDYQFNNLGELINGHWRLKKPSG